MKGIILHGGHGTRLRPLTHTGPKQLLPIANKPMSQYCVEALRDGGITEIAIIIGGNGFQKVKDYYKNGVDFGVKITYILQTEPKGIAHAVRLCKNFVGNEKFVVFLGDNILKKDIGDYVKDFKESTADAVLLLCEVDNPTQFGIADLNTDGSIKKIMEKPKNPPTNLAVTGIYFLTPKIFEIIDKTKPSWRNELEITDTLQNLLQEGNLIRYHSVKNYWKDTGTPNDILHANRIILKDLEEYFLGTKESGVTVEGKVMVGKNSQIKANAKLIGPVIIGDNCIIEDNAVIGPSLSIGDNVHIKKSKIENSIIMSDCEINSDISIKDSIIAYNSKIIQDKTLQEKIFLLGEGSKLFV